jgi:paraquat-inducible protein B
MDIQTRGHDPMKKEVNKTLIGAFTLGAAVLAVIAVLAFGGGSLFRQTDRFVMHFSGSVKGLNIGAPVQLKGVPVGNVIHINLEYSPTEQSFFTQVIIDVPTDSVKIIGKAESSASDSRQRITETSIHSLIEAGLRAKLETQSFVTGQLLVAFDFYPDTPVSLMGFKDDMQELPTLPSDMEALAKTFDTIDFPAVAESINSAAKGIDELANSPDLRKAVASFNDTLKRYGQLAASLDRHVAHLSAEMTAAMVDIRQLVETADGQITPMAAGVTGVAADIGKTIANLDDRLQPVMQNIEDTTASARDAFQQAELMLGNLTHLSDEDSAFIYRIDETMAQLSKAAASLALLADYLGRHPEALLQGKPTTQGER